MYTLNSVFSIFNSGLPCKDINLFFKVLNSSEEIATVKMEDLTAADMDAAVRTIAGSARSMGLNVEGVN